MTTAEDADLRFTPDHAWARRRRDGTLAVGLTDFAQDALGTIVFAGLPEVGAHLDADAPLGEVESTKAVSEIYAPVAGVVVEVNTRLVDAPGTINADPYGDGWICAIAPSDPEEFTALLDPRAYASMIDLSDQEQPSTRD